ncbi:hypothetical protein PGB90_006135 [Kerria lacca]
MVCTVVGNEIHRRSDLTMLPAIFVLLLVSVVFGGSSSVAQWLKLEARNCESRVQARQAFR